MNLTKRNLIGLGMALLWPLLAGAIGTIATVSSVRGWYLTLKKPAWTPPSWLFRVVWSILYPVMGVASWLVWRKGGEENRPALRWYGLQLGLNSLWSILFFGLRRPDLALLEIVVLWSAIAMTIIRFAGISRLAAWLLVPYQGWVTFAVGLNGATWWLNRGER